ncbi:hypothetical protein R70211_01343 [Paraburkholderia domus]|uniref:Uncharacterized protein n=1 Tax=Paraburkholderia domus TaxID=2793075 RepID=A0A9N8MLE4_9BURK|nr:hypothetical protein R70211_01343 [Paraburkholderia domus]
MLVDYITDCEFDESCLNTASLAMAMEYCYQPHPRFWREFSATFVAEAVTQLFQHAKLNATNVVSARRPVPSSWLR